MKQVLNFNYWRLRLRCSTPLSNGGVNDRLAQANYDISIEQLIQEMISSSKKFKLPPLCLKNCDTPWQN